MRFLVLAYICMVVGNIPAYAALIDTSRVIVPISMTGLPKNMAQNNVAAQVFSFEGKPALRVDYQVVDWPNVFFTPPQDVWNWTGYAGMAIDVYNPEAQSVAVCLRVDNPGGDGASNCATVIIDASPKRWTTLNLMFAQNPNIKFWGMRGVPGGTSDIDHTKVSAFQVFLPKPSSKHTLYIRDIKLLPLDNKNSIAFKLPFVDQFGQNIRANYPGKLLGEKDWPKRMKTEAKEIQVAPAVAERDKFGGWAKGPTLKATGWFRTEQVDGKWWLVTPEGHLFFSVGVDTIHPVETTFIDGRDGWFEGLPDPNGPLKEAYGYMSGVHSMAEPIDGKGRTFCFYMANQIRKYGAEWKPEWRNNVYKRLPAWGFNTIANWSDAELLDNSPMPFVATGGVGGNYRSVEGAKGYWGYIPDFFDPNYGIAADASMAALAQRYANNPLCLGYFIDNEMGWETVEKGTLASPVDQPCRVYFINQLMNKYSTIETLNKAWGTDAKDWKSLQNPANPNVDCKRDLGEYVYQFAKKYFETVKNAIHKYDPNHLYLGCRFAWSHPQAVKACADVADVVSFNFYKRQIEPNEFTGSTDLGKPIIIGEFHFGALDRGLLHTGLVPTNSQKERAAAFVNYVKSVAMNPSFVGCHWFQYIDEPLTGRWFDGENYNIGMVDVTDTPYPELTTAAKKINAEVYKLHISAK